MTHISKTLHLISYSEWFTNDSKQNTQKLIGNNTTNVTFSHTYTHQTHVCIFYIPDETFNHITDKNILAVTDKNQKHIIFFPKNGYAIFKITDLPLAQ